MLQALMISLTYTYKRTQYLGECISLINTDKPEIIDRIFHMLNET